jgi:hypothetical protein
MVFPQVDDRNDPKSDMRSQTMNYLCPCGKPATWIRGTTPSAFSSILKRCNGCFERILTTTIADIGKWRRI